jgi:hypothetical protein
MNFHSYGEFPSQQSSDKENPSKRVSQFKAPRRLQSGTLPEQGQGQHFSTQGSTSSGSVSQFNVPQRLQSGTLEEQGRPYAAFDAPPFDGASPGRVTAPSQSLVQQPGKWREQSEYHSPSEMYRSNAALPHFGQTMSLPRVLALPSVPGRDTYFAGDPITHKSGVLKVHPNSISTDPYIGIPASRPSFEAYRQGLSPQFLREAGQLQQSALTQTEPLMKSEAPRKTKTHVTMRVILMGGTGLLLGGIGSFWLLRSPTYLVVTWAIIVIIVSNLVSRELRSYYLLKSTALRTEGAHPSTISISHSVDMGRHPVLKDISDTTGYLKALNLVFKSGHPAQNLFPEEESEV